MHRGLHGLARNLAIKAVAVGRGTVPFDVFPLVILLVQEAVGLDDHEFEGRHRLVAPGLRIHRLDHGIVLLVLDVPPSALDREDGVARTNALAEGVVSGECGESAGWALAVLVLEQSHLVLIGHDLSVGKLGFTNMNGLFGRNVQPRGDFAVGLDVILDDCLADALL